MCVCVSGLLDNEGDCGVVLTSCEGTQGCTQDTSCGVCKVRSSNQSLQAAALDPSRSLGVTHLRECNI